MEEYKTRYTLPCRMYAPDSPVVVETGVLLEGESGRFVKLVLRNSGRTELARVKLSVQPQDAAGAPTGAAVSVEWSALSAASDACFGEDRAPIPLHGAGIVGFSLFLCEVECADGRRLSFPSSPFVPLASTEAEEDYLAACAMAESRDVTKLTAARALFERLGEYKDAPERLTAVLSRIEYLECEVLYISACTVAESRDETKLATAYELFARLGNYKDSRERLTEIGARLDRMRYEQPYLSACAAAESYHEATVLSAIDTFARLGAYKDAPVRLEAARVRVRYLRTEAPYLSACALAKSKDEKKLVAACELFERLGDYKDARARFAAAWEALALCRQEKRKLRKRVILFSSIAVGVLALLLSLLFFFCTEYGAQYRSTSGLVYTELEDGSYAVTDYVGERTKVYIPKRHKGAAVTEIGEAAFADQNELTFVHIPDSVTYIGERAFYMCGGLSSVTIPDGVVEIGPSAFGYCTSLTTIRFGTRVERIGDYAFSQCAALSRILIPVNVKRIGAHAFGDCEALEEIHLPLDILSVGEAAFENTAYYNNKENWIDNALYVDRHLIKVSETVKGSYSIQYGTVSIADMAFYGCREMTTVTIPDNVAIIGEKSFAHCTSLIGVKIPASVRTVGAEAFADCSSLAQASFGHGVKSLGAGVFQNCGALTRVILPLSLLEIGACAFDGCASLSEIRFNGTGMIWNSVKKGADYLRGVPDTLRIVCTK